MINLTFFNVFILLFWFLKTNLTAISERGKTTIFIVNKVTNFKASYKVCTTSAQINWTTPPLLYDQHF